MSARDLCRQAVIAEGRRTLTLTGRGYAALSATERVTPADLFTDTQLRAIERAGFSVFSIRADFILAGPRRKRARPT